MALMAAIYPLHVLLEAIIDVRVLSRDSAAALWASLRAILDCRSSL